VVRFYAERIEHYRGRFGEPWQFGKVDYGPPAESSV
jgi:hypothetical protein